MTWPFRTGISPSSARRPQDQVAPIFELQMATPVVEGSSNPGSIALFVGASRRLLMGALHDLEQTGASVRFQRATVVS